MEDETLNNILNLLQNANSNHTGDTTNNSNANNDIQTLLIKFLLSGGLNQIMNLRNQTTAPKPAQTAEDQKPRTIDLTNYQRLD